MKKVWIIIGIVVIIGIAGYFGRHKIKAMFGGSSQSAMQPTTQTAMQTNAAPSDNIYLIKTDPTKGKYLTDFQGMTLYIFDKDTNGTSTCYDICEKTWPPYTSGATAQSTFPANIAVITRTDGTKQFTWKGKPLYYYASDKKPGDMIGDNIGNIWHIVQP